MRKKYSLIARVTILLAISVFCTGCKDKNNGEINIGYFNNVTHAQALYLKATGNLEKELPDKKVNWKSFNAGPAEVEALFAGQLDIGYIGPVPAITANVKSSGDFMILTGASLAGAELVAPQDSDIESVVDLSGKIVAIPQIGNTQHLCLLKLLDDNGLASVERGGDVTVTAIANADVQNMMDSGNIDAALVPEPWGSTLAFNGAKIVLDYDEVYGGGDYPVAVVIVSKDFYEKNPDTVEKFLKCHNQATKDIENNAESAAEIINAEIYAANGKQLDKEILNSAFSKIVLSTRVNEEAISDFVKICKDQKFIESDTVDILNIYRGE